MTTIFPGADCSTPPTPVMSGLCVWLDADTVPAGAGTTMTDRVNGYVFNGSFTRDLAIGGTPSITLNGVSDLLLSSAVITQLTGISGYTIIAGVTHAANIAVPTLARYGAPGAPLVGGFSVFRAFVGGQIYISNAVVGDVGLAYGASLGPMLTPEVWAFYGDMALPTNEFGVNQKNCAPQAMSAFANANNASVFAAHPLLFGGSGYAGDFWEGSLTQIRVYDHVLTGPESASEQASIALASNIVW